MNAFARASETARRADGRFVLAEDALWVVPRLLLAASEFDRGSERNARTLRPMGSRNPKGNHMQELLIFLPVPTAEEAYFERFIRAAAAFLETTGQVKRRDLGTWQRPARANSTETLRLVALAVPQADGALARALEGVLRSALAGAKLPTSDVRVFVQSKIDAE